MTVATTNTAGRQTICSELAGLVAVAVVDQKQTAAMKAIDRIMEIAASLPEPVDMPQDTKDLSPEEALRIYQKMIKKVT